MNKYELALVVSAKLDNDARAAVVERAKGYISRHDGVVGEVEEWGKRKLAYEIQKQTEAYYYFIQFEGESDCPNELEKRMRIMDNVLRYLVVRKDENDTFKVTPDKADEEVEAEDEEVPAEEAAAEEAPAEEAAAEEAEEAPAEEAAE
ncbi:MAG: 30S ribosomal protein S6 [Lachnospiraceae bacterium]|jgi:small subunit ribosomal protein S6|nr:30S ribosomal protein S6 [Lachnospiraceae bacterium]MBR3232252.1 30S ribosomal protein S6 [Lachnospiraceae bacterium]MBR6397892.1 30S ribosomal protein S6 [Lachnospiraceae bacterium]MBR7015264.1 30S ribosomal protein S6 [Lachnospiraceae bacterium]